MQSNKRNWFGLVQPTTLAANWFGNVTPATELNSMGQDGAGGGGGAGIPFYQALNSIASMSAPTTTTAATTAATASPLLTWNNFLGGAAGTAALGGGLYGTLNSYNQNNLDKQSLSQMQSSGYSLYDPTNLEPKETPPVTEIGGQSLMDSQNSAQQRYLAEILGDINTRRTRTNQAYADLYNQAQMATRRRGGLSDATGFTGGMQQQYQTKVSAAQEANLLNLGTQRIMALQELQAEADAAESNAMLMAQQEFEMMSNQQNQYVNLANNYFARAREALELGETETAAELNAKGDEYMAFADQISSRMGVPVTTPQPGGQTVPTAQTITVPSMNTQTEILGNVGITERAQTNMSKLASNLQNLAASGTDNYFGYDSRALFYQSQILDKIPNKISKELKSNNITIGLMDAELARAIQFYEQETQKSIFKLAPRSTTTGTISKADAKEMLNYYYTVHSAIASSQK